MKVNPINLSIEPQLQQISIRKVSPIERTSGVESEKTFTSRYRSEQDVVIDSAFQNASKAYQVKIMNERFSQVQAVEDKLTSLDERLEAIEGITRMLKQIKNPAYTVTLAKEASELTKSALSKLEELSQMAGYAGLIKPDSAEVFAKMLEKLITSPVMENIPEQLEETWESIVRLRKQVLEMAENIKKHKLEIIDMFYLKQPTDVSIRLDRSATLVHRVDLLQSFLPA